MQSRTPIFLKFAWLIGASCALVLAASPWPFLIVALVQAVLLAMRPIPLHKLKKTTTRLLILVATVFISHLFMATGEQFWLLTLPGTSLSVQVSVAGFYDALYLSLRVLLIVIASVWVQLSSTREQFIGALAALKLPETVALSIDATLALVTTGGDAKPGKRRGGGDGGGQGRGGGGGHKQQDTDRIVTWQQIKQRKVGVLIDLLDHALKRTAVYLQQSYPHLPEARLNQVVLVAGGCVGIMSLRLIQMLPGLPIAPGHKNLVIVPLMLFVAKRFGTFGGGTALGVSVGMVSFMMGFGKFGIFEALHFIVPGILADLLAPLLSTRRGLVQTGQLAVFGAILGAGRFAANAALIVLAGTPIAALVAYAPMFATQVTFGAIGSLFGVVLLSTDFSRQDPDQAHA